MILGKEPTIRYFILFYSWTAVDWDLKICGKYAEFLRPRDCVVKIAKFEDFIIIEFQFSTKIHNA